VRVVWVRGCVDACCWRIGGGSGIVVDCDVRVMGVFVIGGEFM